MVFKNSRYVARMECMTECFLNDAKCVAKHECNSNIFDPEEDR